MQVQSRAESFSVEEGILLIAFDLIQSEVGYLIISSPSDQAANAR